MDPSSSPDPLALSLEDRSRIISTPSRSRSISPQKHYTPRRSKSPQKSVILEPPTDLGTSPWRIKVTVQAEPRDGVGSPTKTTRTITVPLKDPDSQPRSPRRGRAKPSKPQTPKKRPPTPATRKTTEIDFAAVSSPKKARISRISTPSLSSQQPLISILSSPQHALSAVDDTEEDDEDYLESAPNVIGDDTMMKSMDMTIVSPSTLYSRLDMDNSHVEPLKPSKQSPKSPASSLPSPNPDVPSSSPHVKFSSPLVAPTPDQLQRASSASRDGRPPSRSNLKSTMRISPPHLSSKFQSLPTPDSDEKMSEAEINDTDLDQQELIWQREREKAIEQARNAPPEQIIVIEDDSGDEIEDVDMWEEAGNQTSSAENSFISNRPSIANYRQTQRKNVIDTVEEPEDPEQTEEAEQKSAKRSDMSLLFNKFAASRHGQKIQREEESIVDSPDSSKEDLSALIRRKVSKVMDAVDFSFLTPAKQTKQQETKPQTTSKFQRQQGYSQTKTTTIPVKFGDSTSLGSHLAQPAYSPKKSSPLKRSLEFDEPDSIEDTTVSIETDEQDDSRPTKKPTLNSSHPVSRPPLPSRRKSLLKLTQERKVKAAVRASKSRSPSPGLSPELDRERSPPTEDTEAGVLDRLWNYFSHGRKRSPTPIPPPVSSFQHLAPSPSILSSIAESESEMSTRQAKTWPPSRPAHPILKHFRLLPRAHPWSNNHFQALLSLYKHWQTHTHMYSTAHGPNAELLTAQWQPYIGAQFANWGYDLLLSPSLVVVAALFEQLCVLDSADAYEQLYGEKLEMGYVAGRTAADGEIGEWHVALRLFTVAVGDVIRAEEKAGREIDRRPQLRWRLRGQWTWQRAKPEQHVGLF